MRCGDLKYSQGGGRDGLEGGMKKVDRIYIAKLKSANVEAFCKFCFPMIVGHLGHWMDEIGVLNVIV